MTGSDEDDRAGEQVDSDVTETAALAPESTPKVLGETGETDATGVVGRVTASTSKTYGVYGETQSSSNFANGVRGVTVATSGRTFGVYGETQSLESGTAGVKGVASKTGTSATFGVEGTTYSDDPGSAGVIGKTRGSGSGVEGLTYSQTDGSAAVSGAGVYSDTKVFGVDGETPSYVDGAAGVRGQATDTSGVVYGVKGTTDSTSFGAAGVYGEATDTGSNFVHGVHGKTNANGGYGVYAEAPDGEGPALFATAVNGLAVKADGDVTVNGSFDATDVSVSNLGASVHLSSNQSVDAGTRPRVKFDSESTDDNGEFDTGNYDFTPSTNGTYHVEAQVTWKTIASGTTIELLMYKNTLPVAMAELTVGSSGRRSISVSKVLNVGSSDDILFEVSQDDVDGRELMSNIKRTYATFTRMG